MSNVKELELTRKDFVSDQTVRWCPGCGDYAILAQMQKVLPELGIPKEKFVFISGIGCSSRFPYKNRQPRSERVGYHRRRRWSFDWRQPSFARFAPQR